MINELKPFHSNGEIRDRQKAEEEIEVALELIESLGYEKINQEVNGLRRILPNLLNYFEDTKKSVKECESMGIKGEDAKALYLAWQWDKTAMNANDKTRKDRAKEERNFYFDYAKDSFGTKFNSTKEKVFDKLDNIIQASSIIECINSLLRRYFNNSKNQITQEGLKLFMFYHNHRRYRAGKRKGKIPIDILTGQTLEKDWLELLLDIVQEKNPALLV